MNARELANICGNLTGIAHGIGGPMTYGVFQKYSENLMEIANKLIALIPETEIALMSSAEEKGVPCPHEMKS